MDVDKDRTKIDAAPQSTWGATEQAKAKWHQRFGKAAEKAAAEAEKEKRD